MAQDFFAAFGHDGIGTIGNDTTLSSADFDGINFIAIQALEKRTTTLKNENEELKSKFNQILSENIKMKEKMAKMEKDVEAFKALFTEYLGKEKSKVVKTVLKY
jgi:hypothetical protein